MNENQSILFNMEKLAGTSSNRGGLISSGRGGSGGIVCLILEEVQEEMVDEAEVITGRWKWWMRWRL